MVSTPVRSSRRMARTRWATTGSASSSGAELTSCSGDSGSGLLLATFSSTRPRRSFAGQAANVSRRRWRVQERRLRFHATAEQAQANVLAKRERAEPVHGQPELSELVRLVVIVAYVRGWLARGKLLSLEIRGYVQQARGGLHELAADEHALGTLCLERHAQSSSFSGQAQIAAGLS